MVCLAQEVAPEHFGLTASLVMMRRAVKPTATTPARLSWPIQL